MRASKKKTQISQAQLRANSGVSVRVTGKRKEGEDSRASAFGKVQAKAEGARGESWFGKAETGVAETGCDPGRDCLAAQQLALLPQWQQGRAAPATLTPDAGTMFVHTSIRLQTMASAVFMA